MLEELKELIEATKDTPRAQRIFLSIAEMPEDRQQGALDGVQALIKLWGKTNGIE